MLALAVSLLTASCGDPLADGAWEGVDLLPLHGTLKDLTGPGCTFSGGEPSMAVYWARGSGEVIEQAVVTRGSFPARFSTSLTVPPPDSALFEWPGSGHYAIGLMLAYVGDCLAGGARDYVVLYTPDGVTLPVDDGNWYFGPGAHRVLLEEGGACDDGQFGFEPLAHAAAEGEDLPLEVRLGEPFPFPDLDCNGVADEFYGQPCAVTCPGSFSD